MSKLEQIVAFVSVVQHQGFAEAARAKGTSTATISRLVSRLESDLKIPLLKRTTRRVSLTDLGAQYYEQVCQGIELLETAEQLVTASCQNAVGLLRITSSRYFAVHTLLPKLPEFMEQNPFLRVNLELSERMPNLLSEEIDILFGTTLDGPPDAVRKEIAITQYVLCASPAYLQQYGMPKTIADLSKHHYIEHSGRNTKGQITFPNGQDIYLEPKLWLNDSRAILESAIRGLGIVHLHDYIVEDALQSGELVALLTTFSWPSRSVNLYYLKRRYCQPKIKRFIEFFVARD